VDGAGRPCWLALHQVWIYTLPRRIVATGTWSCVADVFYILHYFRPALNLHSIFQGIQPGNPLGYDESEVTLAKDMERRLLITLANCAELVYVHMVDCNPKTAVYFPKRAKELTWSIIMSTRQDLLLYGVEVDLDLWPIHPSPTASRYKPSNNKRPWSEDWNSPVSWF